MNVDEAWESFIKSHQIKKTSIDEKLDVIASQMNELQTDVSRLAENIPEMQGDAAAMETANAMAEPEMGAEPGLDELGAMMGDEGGPMPEESAPMGGEEPMPEGAPMTGDEDVAAPGDEISDAELDALLGGEDMGAPEMGGAGNDMIAKIKELIINEDDPGKLAALSELLSLAASSDDAYSMESLEEVGAPEDYPIAEEPALAEEPMDEETEPVGKSETFEKAGDAGVDTPTEAKEATTDAVDKPLDDGPEPMTSESVTKACDSGDLMSRIMEAITPIIREYIDGPTASPIEEIMSGATEPEVVVDVETDAMPIDEEPAEAPVAEGPAVAEDESKEEGSEEKEGSDEESGDDKKGDEKDEDEDEDVKDPEDDISEDTDHFEESDCESEPVMKSFLDLFSQRMESKVGVDGMYTKVPAHMRPAELKDGFKEAEYAPIYKSADEDMGGKHIMTLEEMSAIQKSNRPGATIAVNGEIERPDPTTFKKSGATSVSFEELMNASDRHEIMQKEWDEYNLFKSRF